MAVRSKSSHTAGAKNGAWRPIGPGQVWVLSSWWWGSCPSSWPRFLSRELSGLSEVKLGLVRGEAFSEKTWNARNVRLEVWVPLLSPSPEAPEENHLARLRLGRFPERDLKKVKTREI